MGYTFQIASKAHIYWGEGGKPGAIVVLGGIFLETKVKIITVRRHINENSSFDQYKNVQTFADLWLAWKYCFLNCIMYIYNGKNPAFESIYYLIAVDN